MPGPWVISLPVKDVEAAARFYVDAFGAKVDEPDEAGARSFHVLRDRPTFRLVHSETPPQPSTTPVIEWVVDDFDSWVERAAAAGARIKNAEGGGYAHVIDPFGYYWALERAED
jgi:uncharacterized glyoxalase superfamily protein PhnB